VIIVPESDDLNIAILTLVVDALGDLCDSLVFVGGCATGLLVTTTRAQSIRVTDDVDVLAQVASVQQYHALETAVQSRGFSHDLSDDAPICRWLCDGVKLDLMPSEPGILGFHNQWYPLAIETAQSVMLPSKQVIKLISAPAFVATKLEAFRGRGGGDYLLSHDLEDIITIVDGRVELCDEIQQSAPSLRRYLSEQFGMLLASNEFLQAVPGHLPGDAASQARLPGLVQKIRALVDIKTS